MTSQLFATAQDDMANTPFGHRRNGRYKMPLLPGEQGTKSGGDWVPRGIQSTTEMVSAFAESRALNVWEQEQLLYGLYRQHSLCEKATLMFAAWERQGVDFSRLRDFPEVRQQLTGGFRGSDDSIVGQAKTAAGANEPREAGTNRHTAWEHWCKTGEYIGTPDMQQQIGTLVELLERKRLQVIPDLCERVIRNVTVKAAGRFDNIVLDQATGRLLMADLKTKKRPFWSWMEVDAQLATYAYAEWMLDLEGAEKCVPYRPYIPGPKHHVDLKLGVVLQMPSDGGEPYLRRADLEYGWRVAQKAREIIDMRAYGKSAERHVLAEW